MRTAVLRINVDPAGELTVAQVARGLAALREQARSIGAEVLDNDVAGKPGTRREVQFLVETGDPEATQREAVRVCSATFGTAAAAGAVTFVSRGTDEDARGVLAGFGLTGEIVRETDADGFDVVSVTLPESALDRVPESRVQTALEASLNCEVRIRTC
jgi:hypothetical protein